jgi:hypothetical protein
MKAIREEQIAWVQERQATVSPAEGGEGGAAALDLESVIYATFPASVLVEGCL